MKKLLVSLLVGFILFSALPVYAFVSEEEAKKYIGKSVLVIDGRPQGAIGTVMSVDKYTDLFRTETYLVIVGFDKKVYLFNLLHIIKIQELDMFGFPIEE